MNTKLILAVCTAFLLAGCGATPSAIAPATLGAPMRAAALKDFPPMIQYVTVNGMMGSSFTVAPSTQLQLSCMAMGGTGMLTYNWFSWGVMGMGSFATWLTPSTEGLYTIEIQVMDSKSQMSTDEVWFQVQKNATLKAIPLSAADKARAKAAPTH